MGHDLWHRLPKPVKNLLSLNNTLMGIMVIGPLLGQWLFMREDAKLISKGDMRVALGWALHLPPAGIVIVEVLTLGTMPLWMVFLAS